MFEAVFEGATGVDSNELKWAAIPKLSATVFYKTGDFCRKMNVVDWSGM